MANSSASVTSQNNEIHHSNHNNATNKQITINLKVKQRKSLKVNANDSIRKVKQMFMHKGISESLLELSYGDEKLENDKTLAYYNIGDESTMKLKLNTTSDGAMTLYVKAPFDDHTFELYVREDDTISLVRCMLMLKEKLGYNDFDLLFRGTFLQNHQTLSTADIDNESLLYMVPRPKDSQLIRVIIVYPRDVFNLEVKKYQTIGELKADLTSMTNSQSEGAKLTYAGKKLKSSRTVASYNIEERGSVSLMTKFPVTVQLYSGGFTTVDVYPTDDVGKVIAKILKDLKVAYRPHPLFFNDARLDEDRTIEAYEVMEGSTLRLGGPWTHKWLLDA